MSNKFETDIINKRFKNCIVIKHCGYIKGSKARKSIYECLCDCGKIFVADRTFLTNRTKNHRSCGCKKFKFGPNHTAWQGHGLISKDLWTQLQRGAKNRNIEFTISIEYVWDLFEKQNGKCILSGLEISFAPTGSSKYSRTASLDRIDPSKGYIKDNVQWIHKHVNYMKWQFDQDYFIQMCKNIIKTQEGEMRDA